MVSAFFGQGAAEGFRKQQALDIQEGQLGLGRERLDILREELTQKASQNRLRRVADTVTQSQERLNALTTLANSRDPRTRAQGMKLLELMGPQLKRVIETGTAMTSGTSMPAFGIPKIEDEPVRTVKSRTPSGDVRTQLFRGETPVADLGAGPSVQFQPQTAPKATSKEAADLDAAEVATRNVISTGFELKKLIDEGGPEALSAAGDVSLGIQNLRSGIEGFANVFGMKIDRFEDGTATLNADKKAEGVFERMGVAADLNAQIKSDIVNLAFAAAAAAGSTGKAVSDKDFERFVTELGKGAKNPETFKKVLDRFMGRINRNFQNRYIVAARRRKDLDPDNVPDILGEAQKKRLQAPKSPAEMSDDELKRQLGIQ